MPIAMNPKALKAAAWCIYQQGSKPFEAALMDKVHLHGFRVHGSG